MSSSRISALTLTDEESQSILDYFPDQEAFLAESAVAYLSVTSAAYAVSRARVTGGWGRLSWTTRSPMPTAAPV